MVAIFNSLSRNAYGAPALDVGNGPFIPSNYINGLPIDTAGRVYAVDVGTIDSYVNGVPLDSDGRVCIDIEGAFSYFGPGAMPFTSGGLLVVSRGPADITNYAHGVAFTNVGAAIEFSSDTIGAAGGAFSNGFSSGFEV